MEAARELNARGISQTSLNDIADRLGISRAAIYYYVEDRQDLVFQCYRHACERLAQHLRHASRIAASPLAAITGFVTFSLTSGASDGAAEDFATLSEVGYLTADQRDTILGLYQGVSAHLSDLIEQGAAQGQIRAVDAAVVARAVLGMILWAPISGRWSVAVAGVTHAAAAQMINEVILQGIVADRTPRPIPRLDLSPLLVASGGVFDRAFLTQARRNALLTSASHLFNQKGVDATSMEEIAAAAGATKRAVLHHFGDKASLIEACYRRAYEMFLFVPRQARLMPGSRRDALAAAWFGLCEAYLREDLRPLTPISGFEALKPDAQREVERLSAALSDEYLALMGAARDEGSLRDFDQQAFLFVVSGAFGWLSKETASLPATDRDKASQTVSDLLMLGLAQPPQDSPRPALAGA